MLSKIQVMVVSDDVFQTIGIDEKNEHYYCCDDQAYDVRFSFGGFTPRTISARTIIICG